MLKQGHIHLLRVDKCGLESVTLLSVDFCSQTQNQAPVLKDNWFHPSSMATQAMHLMVSLHPQNCRNRLVVESSSHDSIVVYEKTQPGPPEEGAMSTGKEFALPFGGEGYRLSHGGGLLS